MMDWIIGKLKKAGVIPSYDADDRINAEIEDAAVNLGKQVEGMKTATERRRQSNAALRGALQRAKSRTSSFEEFEDFIERNKRDAR